MMADSRQNLLCVTLSGYERSTRHHSQKLVRVRGDRHKRHLLRGSDYGLDDPATDSRSADASNLLRAGLSGDPDSARVNHSSVGL